MRQVHVCLLFSLLALLFVGCATTLGGGNDKKLAKEYLAKAQTQEKANDLPAAMEYYKLALTADAKNEEARAGHDRLAQKLAQMADERYRMGMKYYRQGKYSLARKEFLTALRYQPDHPQASKILVSRDSAEVTQYVFHVIQPGESLSLIADKYYGDKRKYDVIAKFNNLADATKIRPGQRIMIPDVEGMLQPADAVTTTTKQYVEHALQPGESISKLAQRYYGDYKQFHIIAQYNNLDDATRVSVGQILKIPRVTGLPFNVPQAEQPQEPIVAEGPPPAEPVIAPHMDDDKEPPPAEDDVYDQLTAYRDAGIALYKEGNFEDAIFELVKAVEAMPQDDQTRDYLSRSYFETGKLLLGQQEFSAAKESFESALQYDSGCNQCRAYIEKSELGPLMVYRETGLAHLQKGKFAAAVTDLAYYLQHRPDDEEIQIQLSKAHYQLAMAQYQKGNYLEAKEGFESALEYDNSCDKCSELIIQSATKYKEAHYNRGIAFFNQEQLREAIAEWQMVYDLDPQYKDVAPNLSKARDILKRLEQIERSQPSQP